MKVARWGNSLAVRLPKSVTEALSLKEGDDLELRVDATGEVRLCQKMSRREWLESLEKHRGLIPADFKFDRDEANARG